MFTGEYSFFDYKYNIKGYVGQDFGGLAQHLYLAVSVILLVLLLNAGKKRSEEETNRTVGCIGIFLTIFYLVKTGWESYYDIRLSGAFNTCLLPLDTCSFIMPAALLAGFGRGRVQHMAKAWITTGGILGGASTMVSLNAFNFYPFFSFGALYSMLWHFLMVFTGLLLVTAEHTPLPFSRVKEGYFLHFLVSLPVIAVDLLFGYDFMLYRDLGGVPFFGELASRFSQQGLGFLNPPLMLLLYFTGFSLIRGISMLCRNRHVIFWGKALRQLRRFN